MDFNDLETLVHHGDEKIQNQIVCVDEIEDTNNDENEVVDGGGGGGGERRLSIAERRAAKCGFNAKRISAPRFRSPNATLLASPGVRSPCLTISPGISPTALFDFPVLLPNSQPSPTTGTYPFSNNENSPLNSSSPGDVCRGNDIESSSGFNSHKEMHSLQGFSSLKNQVSSPFEFAQSDNPDCQAVNSVEPPKDFEFPEDLSKEITLPSCDTDSITHFKVLSGTNTNGNQGSWQVCSSDIAIEQGSLQREPLIAGEDVAWDHNLKCDKKGIDPPVGAMRTSEDGYNWRKYGQKQVKGSEYPRSYYKCTHPNCQVKKKVERSHDGQISEIIYKGAHNHQKPNPNRRTPFGSVFSFDGSESGEGNGIDVQIQSSNKDVAGSEMTSSKSGRTDLSDPSSSGVKRKFMDPSDPAETSQCSSEIRAGRDDDDRATHGSMRFDGCAEDEESEAQRRKMENCLIETSIMASSRAVREPRVVVQIESDIDILDDGYRWRKYGQKVVKGNPNPRSYYKCTSAGCPVRKHVERASHNLKCVITTYEGKHDHEVPSARNSSHVNLGLGNNMSNSGTANNIPPTTCLFPRSHNALKPEAQIENLKHCFDRETNFMTDYGPGRGFLSTSPLYKMNFPPLQNTLLYSSFALNSDRVAVHQIGPMPSIVPDFPISLPLGLPASSDLPLDGFDFNRSSKVIGSFQSFHLGQVLNDEDIKFRRPKLEQKEDYPFDACFAIMGHANASPSSSVYQHVMGDFPL